MSKMKLSELIKLYHDVNLELITYEEFKEVLNSVYVKAYMPLKEKIANVTNVLFGFEYNEESDIEKYAQLEMNKFWYIMMPYVDIEIESDYINEENYELLYPSFNNAIRIYADKDINHAFSILDNMLEDSRYGQIIDIFQSLSGTNFEDLIKADNELIKQLSENQDFVSNLVQLFNHTNPTVGQINKNIEKSIVEEINKTKE